MVSTPSKRSASTTPDGARPLKRQATSSPEEGELDDASPSPVAPATSAATPPLKLPSKVKFPFKKKSVVEPEEIRKNGDSRAKGMVYEHVFESQHRHKEDEDWRRSRPRSRQGRHDVWTAASRAGDRWEPTADRYETGRWAQPQHSYPSRYPPREREADVYRPNSPPRRDWERERRRSSRSVSSPRSRSPLSPASTKEKHRLPPPRSTTSVKDNYYDTERFSRRDDDYSREHRPRDEDRHYRPPPLDDRWDARRDWHRDRRRDGGSLDREGDSYRPVSPRAITPPRPLSPHTPPRPQVEHKSPMSSQQPPVSPANTVQPSALSTGHLNVASLPSKKPTTPANIHSPVSVPLAKTRSDTRKAEKKDEKRQVTRESVVQRPKRKPVERTREDEERLYGRMFVGCGRQEDYDVLTKLGEGTFGEVHKAVHHKKGHVVALKRILMHNEKEGMPVTALREIKILKALKHPCIVDILDMFVVKSNGRESPLSVYMVFPYMDHDLAGLLENERVKLSPSQIKLYMKQLLEGTEYMHRNHILHRDMKAANLLISNTGSLKVADFGLARAYDPNIVRGGEFKEDLRGKERKYTNCVVTRWYRPPELLLGARQYGGEVDMWGIGCVLGEMFSRRPILPGTSDLDQLDRIWQLCGTPNQHSWPNFDMLPGCEGVKRFQMYSRRVKQTYETTGPETCDLLDKLLTCNPRERITASQALDHDYFWTDPLPADPKTLPTYEASHEFDKRGRRHQGLAGLPGPMHMDGPPRPLPMPLIQQHPMHSRRGPPPPREVFRTGPPPQHYPHPPFPPPSSFSAYPPPGYPHPPPPPPRYPVGGPGPPMMMPPYSLHPGQPPPPMPPWQQPQAMNRPAHLPARPPIPVGRGGGYNPRDPYQSRQEALPGYGGGELNYG
ncbi:hypothetical protein SCP_1500880 [Sparassis crispa]|uniref:Protein kinase domain-containing protein n=1 Tax=Sparassis crispa TaxID=139825 RepID=A0A401H3S0_9APHY|nr:hypothetical protein SCP_1500880 [Sparassis crispa]GBE89085.1 hypothetical protein SCP_1500880 [Sparassis crispa]